jgi:hypothetical protein
MGRTVAFYIGWIVASAIGTLATGAIYCERGINGIFIFGAAIGVCQAVVLVAAWGRRMLAWPAITWVGVVMGSLFAWGAGIVWFMMTAFLGALLGVKATVQSPAWIDMLFAALFVGTFVVGALTAGVIVGGSQAMYASSVGHRIVGWTRVTSIAAIVLLPFTGVVMPLVFTSGQPCAIHGALGTPIAWVISGGLYGALTGLVLARSLGHRSLTPGAVET